jgi:hypothetical protein
MAVPDRRTPDQRRWRVLLGLEPDDTLMACGLRPYHLHGLTWGYEHASFIERRKATAALQRRVESLKTALSPLLGLEPWAIDLHVPLAYADRQAGVEVDEDPDPEDPEPVATVDPVRLVLPDHFQPATKPALVGLISERLLGDWSARWHMDRHPHVVELTRRIVRPRPPKSVEWELSPDPYSIFVGRSGTEKVYVKTETETPHWAVSAGTGGGKTTTLLLPAIHWRAHGGLVDVIDMKQDSFENSVQGVSGFRVHTDAISAVMAMSEFLLSAMSVSRAVKRGFPADQIQPRVMLIDEFGSFVTYVDIWWREVLGKKGSAPVHSWFHVGLMQGRSKNHRFVVGTHDFGANTFKGTGPRDLLGTKILIGPISMPRWVTTFGHDFKKVKHQAKRVGRAVMGITGTQPEEVQIAYPGEADEIRALVSGFQSAPEWFDNGEMAPWIDQSDIEMANNAVNIIPFLPGGEYVSPPGSQDELPPSGQPGEAGSGLRLVPTPEQKAARENAQPVGLRQALTRDLLPQLIREAGHRNPDLDLDDLIDKAIEVMRTARKKDSRFPRPVGQRGSDFLYRLGDLREWEEGRPHRMRFDDNGELGDVAQ